MVQKAASLASIASLASFVALAAGCSGGGGGSFLDAGVSGSGGSSASGGTSGAGATAGAGGASGSGGGSAGAGAFGGGGAGSAGSSGGTSGAPPMCTTSAECSQADVSYPGNTGAPSPSPTECVGGQCGLVTAYSGSYDEPKSPRSCTEICAASTYEGEAMACSASCTKKTINGFGDQGLVFNVDEDGGSGAPGSVAGLVRYQFSPISGAYKFVEIGCGQVPTSKLIQSGNSYTYVGHYCCCVAP